jgi:multiple sugar transport system substrate-binding protein
LSAQPSRRKFLKYVGAGAAIAAVAGVGGYAYLSGQKPGNGNSSTSTSSTSTYVPPAGATSDYAEFMGWLASVAGPYAGATLDISLEYEFQPLGVQAIDPDFFRATGINDHYELKVYELHLADISQLASTHASNYDIIGLDYHDMGSYSNLVLSPSELADMYPEITYQKINPQDFRPTAWSLCATYPPNDIPGVTSTTTSSGDIIGYIPFDMSTMIQYYRQDLYRSAGLTPATTWDEYLSNAKTLKSPSIKFSTVNEASQQIPIVYEFLNFLQSYGGSLWGVSNGQITTGLGSSAALNALETYSSLFQYADAASVTYSWDNVATDLYHSIAGMAIEFQGYESYMEDPARSRIVGEIAYAPVPAGPSGSFPLYGGSGVGISKYSKNPKAAWLWLQWATSLGAQETTLLGYYHPFPSRTAVFNNSTIQSALSTSQFRAVNAAKTSWDAGNLATLTPFPKWLDVLDPISFYLNESYRGAMTPQDALTGAIQKIGTWGALNF